MHPAAVAPYFEGGRAFRHVEQLEAPLLVHRRKEWRAGDNHGNHDMGILRAAHEVFPADAEALLANGARAQTLGRHDIGPAWDGKVVRNLVRVPEFNHGTLTHDHRGGIGLHAGDLDRRVLGGQDLRLGADQHDHGIAPRRRWLDRDGGVLNPPVAQKTTAGLEVIGQDHRAMHDAQRRRPGTAPGQPGRESSKVENKGYRIIR